MLAMASTTVAFLTGVTVTGAGDEEEAGNAKVTGVPASIRMGRQTHRSESTQTPRGTQYATMRISPHYDLTGITRVRDERTGEIWLIDENWKPSGSPVPADQIVNLKRTL